MITAKRFVLLQTHSAAQCFASCSPYSLFHGANNHFFPFILSFLPILLALFLLYRIKLHFCA